MKKLSLLALSLISIACANASDNVIFGAKVTLDDSCEISVSHNEQRLTFKPKFNNISNCRLVTHDETNIVNIKFVNGAYVFFIENNHTNGDKCSSEYTAVGLSKDLVLHTTAMIKNSLSCNQGQEIQSFEYFSAKLKPQT